MQCPLEVKQLYVFISTITIGKDAKDMKADD
jgi:hypothetical protein